MKARIEFKLEDFWVGVFWKRGFDELGTAWEVDPDWKLTPEQRHIQKLDVWICLIPCFPLHLTFGGFPIEFREFKP